MTKVFKFGGALLKDADGIQRTTSIIQKHQDENLVVVVSAIGKTTNALEKLVEFKLSGDQPNLEKTFIQIRQNHFELAESVFGNARHRIYDHLNELFTALNNVLKQDFSDRYFAYDQVVRFGELLSSTIVNSFLEEKSIHCHLINAGILIRTNDNYTAAKINWIDTEKAVKKEILPLFEQKVVVLTQGFIGMDEQGNYTTLGREGSDFTAAVLGNILDANEVTIWKNVPGLMNADPNRFDDSVKLDKISYHEAIELAFYGASVIHPKTIQPVQQKKIPLFVRSFYEPGNIPSVISDDQSEDDQFQKLIVKDNQVLFSIGSKDLAFIAEENLTRIFDAFSKQKVHVNLMQHSAVSFSVCFDDNTAKLRALVADLGSEFIVKYNQGLQLITIRHYNDEIIRKLTASRKIYLEQKSRATIQLLIK